MSIDWQRILFDISRSGFSLPRLSEKIGKSRGWARDICRNNTEPKYSDGQKILEIHRKLFDNTPI